MQYVIDVSDGYDYIGPFSRMEDARACIERLKALEPDADYLIRTLTNPDECETDYRR